MKRWSLAVALAVAPPVARMSAAAFEVVRKDFLPAQDLKLVYFTRTPPP